MIKKWVSIAVISAMLFSTIGVSGMSEIVPSQDDVVFDGPTIEEFDFNELVYVGTGDTGPKVEGTERLTVNPNYISFDPLTEKPLLPKELANGGDIYMVQFKGTIYPYAKNRVTALGAELLQYIPYYAFAVRMDPSTVDDVKELPFIRAVTPYYLFYKIAPDTIGLTDGKALVNFMAWRHHPTEDIAGHARAIGADIDWIDPMMVRAWVDRTQLLSIASNPDVWYAQLQPTWDYHNNIDSDIIDVRHYPDGAYVNPTDGIWSYSGGIGGTFDGLATGLGVIVADVDTGVDGTHNNFGDATDYPNKKVYFKSYASGNTWFDSNGHGTHTSGTVLGIGKHRGGSFDGLYTGMAPEAGLVGIRMDGGSVYRWMNDPYDNGANISTNSWGGGQLGSYDQSSAAYDALVIDVELNENGDQHMTTFFSAGNSGQNGVSPPATSKNVISVGASGGTTGSQNSVAGFSSRGPLADGRLKPEIVAPGTSITSSWRGSTDFTNAQGTSMSCPTAAGAAALIIEYYNTTHGFTPSPALIKALMTNGATVLGYTYPGNTQGWGRINLANTMIESATKKIFFKDEDDTLGLDSGTFVSYPVTVNSGAELRIQVAWLDEPATPGANPALVNDLDVRFKDPSGTIYMGNSFNAKYSKATTAKDTKNNLEGFRFATPATGQWTLEIIGSNVPSGPQVWAMVISGDISVGNPTLHFQDFGLTDLTFSDPEPSEGDDITISGTIKNAGNMPGADIEFRILIDDMIVESGTITTLGVGAEKDISTIWNAVRGKHNIEIVIDPLDRLVELSEDNNTLDQVLTVNNFGVELKMDPKLQEVEPGENATFKLEVRNIGTITDTFDLGLSDPPDGFTYDLEFSTVDIASGERAMPILTVSTPDKAEAGTRVVATVTVTSQGNTTYNPSVTATTEIEKILGFDITPIGNTSMYVEPIGSVEFEMDMTNHGNSEEMVVITTSTSNGAFTSSTNATELQLGPYTNEEVKLTIAPPFQPMGGDYVIVDIEAETSSDLSDLESFMVTVIDYHNLSVETTVEDNEVDPGQGLEFQSVISNFGNNDESVEMWSEMPEDWNVVFGEDVPYILAYGFLENFFTVSVPDDALAGTYNITIGVIGEFLEYEEEFEIIVTQNFGVGLEISPIRSSVKQNEKVTHILKVTNEGNGEDTYETTIAGGPSNLRATLDVDEVTLGPGETKEIRVTFEAVETLPGSYSLTAEAVSQGNSAKADMVRFQIQVIEVPKEGPKEKQKPKPPIISIDDDPNSTGILGRYGLFLLIGLLALIAIVTLAFVAMRRRRKANELDQGLEAAGPGPGGGPYRSMDSLETEGPPGTEPVPPSGPPPMGPPPQPPGGSGPPSSPPEGPPMTEGPVGPPGMMGEPAPPAEGPTEPQPAPEPAPPVEEVRTDEPAVDPSTKKSDPKVGDIDSMISDLMGKID